MSPAPHERFLADRHADLACALVLALDPSRAVRQRLIVQVGGLHRAAAIAAPTLMG